MSHRIFYLPKAVPLSSGAIMPGAKLSFFLTATSTPTPVYTDAGLSVAHTQPVVADASGTVPTIYLDSTLQYKVTITSAADVLLYTVDPCNDQTPNFYARTSEEIAASVTPTFFQYEPVDPRRYTTNAQFASVYAQINALSEYNDWARREHSLHPSETNCIVGLMSYDDSLMTGTDGYQCSAFGVRVLFTNSDSTAAGGNNNAFGFESQYSGVDTSGNCSFGSLTGREWTGIVSAHNNAFGHQSQTACVTGTQNNSYGYRSLFSLVTGDNNCAYGDSALRDAVTISGVTCFGTRALLIKTAGDFTVALGYEAGVSETTAVGNTLCGYRASFATTTAGGNSVFGYEAGGVNALGASNSLFGYQAGRVINAGTHNAVFGWQAGLAISSGVSNSCFGQQSGNAITTGSELICIGNSAGTGLSTATKSIAIGGASFSSGNHTNSIVIGWNAQSNGTNTITLGDTNITAIYAQVTSITMISDMRDKQNIAPISLGLDFIRRVTVCEFDWDIREGSSLNGTHDAGIIAQDLQTLQEEFDCEWLGLVTHTNKDQLRATPGKLLMPLIRAVQEQSDLIDRLRADLSALQAA